MNQRVVRLSALLLTLAAPASAQLISIKTVRLAQADQFDIFPSLNLAMGGVSIALADSLLDPLVNPAKGARIGASRLFGSPAIYSVTSDAGGGRTLPLGTLLRTGPWFGGVALALQQVDAARSPQQQFFNNPAARACVALAGVDCTSIVPPALPPLERSHGNELAFGTLGRVLPGTGLSIGASVFWARLTGVDGVDLLYPQSARVSQLGHTLDLRIGALKEWAGDRSLEALILHSRFGMTHDVTYLDLFWDPGAQQILQRPRMEENLDRTNAWGLHLAYQRPLAATGWRIGWITTGNRMTHPKIPNYEIMDIPRDPGYSWAWNLGMGVSRREGTATFGADAIYEPIRSTTWADAETPVATLLGDTIPAGGRTIENRFHFSNALFRLGFGDELDLGRGASGKVAGLQLGLAVRSINYRLAQQDNVSVTSRHQTEHWIEWTPTWGVSLRFPKLEIRYRGRVTTGTGRPGVAGGCFDVCVAVPDRFAAGPILIAPSGPLTLEPVHVFIHSVSFALPLR